MEGFDGILVFYFYWELGYGNNNKKKFLTKKKKKKKKKKKSDVISMMRTVQKIIQSHVCLCGLPGLYINV